MDLGHATANAYNNLAYYLWSTDGPAVALEIHEEALEFCERRGIEDLGQYIKAGGLDYLFELGRWDELLSLSDELLDCSSAHGARQVEAVALVNKAAVLVHRGDVPGA